FCLRSKLVSDFPDIISNQLHVNIVSFPPQKPPCVAKWNIPFENFTESQDSPFGSERIDCFSSAPTPQRALPSLEQPLITPTLQLPGGNIGRFKNLFARFPMV